MTTDAKLAANRRNAQRSTGPKTDAGKAASARNATRHGIFSGLKVLPGAERPENWATHMDAVLRDLEPVGHLETILAERVALYLWRLGRVARYEREKTAVSLEAAEKDAAENAMLGSVFALSKSAGDADMQAENLAQTYRRTRILPAADQLDKIARYENHLERCLFRTLHELQRLQDGRVEQSAA